AYFNSWSRFHWERLGLSGSRKQSSLSFSQFLMVSNHNHTVRSVLSSIPSSDSSTKSVNMTSPFCDTTTPVSKPPAVNPTNDASARFAGAHHGERPFPRLAGPPGRAGRRRLGKG